MTQPNATNSNESKNNERTPLVATQDNPGSDSPPLSIIVAPNNNPDEEKSVVAPRVIHGVFKRKQVLLQDTPNILLNNNRQSDPATSVFTGLTLGFLALSLVMLAKPYVNDDTNIVVKQSAGFGALVTGITAIYLYLTNVYRQFDKPVEYDIDLEMKDGENANQMGLQRR